MISKVDYICNLKSCLVKSAKYVSYCCNGLLVEYVPSKKGQRFYASLVGDLVKVANDLEGIVKRLEVVDMI